MTARRLFFFSIFYLPLLLFVLVDMGRPDRFWHILPFIGRMNLPGAIMAWDAVVLNIYLVINLSVASYLVSCTYHRIHYNPKVVVPLVEERYPAKAEPAGP